MSTNTPKDGEEFYLCAPCRSMVDCAHQRRCAKATGTERDCPTCRDYITRACPTCGTGTEQDIPAASEWPDEDLISAAMRAHNATAGRAGSNAFANRPGMRAALAVALADHHHALSKAVQAEHDRWVEKLRAEARRLRGEGALPGASENCKLRHEARARGVEWAATLLAEAKATDAAAERREGSG